MANTITQKPVEKKKPQKTKKISINSFEKVMAETYNPYEIAEWHGIEVTIKKNLSLNEMATFVNRVVSSCFSGGDGQYLPEVKDFAIKSSVIDTYANFNMPANVHKQYELVYHTNAYEFVCRHININQLEEMNIAIDKKIDYMLRVNIESVENKIQDMYERLNKLSDSLSQIFEGVDNDTMLKLISSISEGKLDEEKLISAYFERKTDDTSK